MPLPSSRTIRRLLVVQRCAVFGHGRVRGRGAGPFRILVVVLLFATLIPIGCSSSKGASSSDLEKRYRLSEDVGRWALPLDSFHGVDATLVQDAENLLVEKCMTQQGFSWEIPAPHEEPNGEGIFNRAGRRLFSIEIARRHGYRVPAELDPSSIELNERDPTPAELEALTGQTDPNVGFDGMPRGCVGKVRSNVTRPSERLLDHLEEAAYDRALLRPEVRTARKRWGRCLRGRGVQGATPRPEDMPGSAMASEIGLSEDLSGEPTPSEIQLAVVDATCQRSSGYSDALYAQEWSSQMDALVANDEELAQVRDHNERVKRAVRAVLRSAEGG